MKSFKLFLESATFRQDNPGGSWLKNKQEDAEDRYDRLKGFNGAITGHFSKVLRLPVEHLIKLPGAMGEEKFRNYSSKMENLSDGVGDPSNFDSSLYPILVGVNHRGEGFIVDGNHRLAYAHKHNMPYIHAEVRYFNGGEDHEGEYSPKNMLALHTD